jgi:hypothetical protein
MPLAWHAAGRTARASGLDGPGLIPPLTSIRASENAAMPQWRRSLGQIARVTHRHSAAVLALDGALIPTPDLRLLPRRQPKRTGTPPPSSRESWSSSTARTNGPRAHPPRSAQARQPPVDAAARAWAISRYSRLPARSSPIPRCNTTRPGAAPRPGEAGPSAHHHRRSLGPGVAGSRRKAAVAHRRRGRAAGAGRDRSRSHDSALSEPVDKQ